MSPVPMMNEMSTPTVHLEAQVLMCAEILRKKGKFVPDICFAGGFTNETQMFKSMAMSNLGDGPLVKAIGMARSPLLTVMKSKHFLELAETKKLPKAFVDQYTDDPNNFFIVAKDMAKKYPNWEIGKDIPYPAVGLYTYFVDRLGEGLKQLMAGARKFRLDLLDRSDIKALTPYASQVTGIETIDANASRVIPGILEYWD